MLSKCASLMQEKQAILDMGRTWQFKKRKAHVQTFKDVQQSDKRPCVKQTVSSSASFSPVSPSIITIFIVIIAPLFMPGISIAFSALCQPAQSVASQGFRRSTSPGQNPRRQDSSPRTPRCACPQAGGLVLQAFRVWGLIVGLSLGSAFFLGLADCVKPKIKSTIWAPVL